jgi:hypothetical protein
MFFCHESCQGAIATRSVAEEKKAYVCMPPLGVYRQRFREADSEDSRALICEQERQPCRGILGRNHNEKAQHDCASPKFQRSRWDSKLCFDPILLSQSDNLIMHHFEYTLSNYKGGTFRFIIYKYKNSPHFSS